MVAMTDDRDEVAPATHLDAKHREARLGVVEGHALDQPRQRFQAPLGWLSIGRRRTLRSETKSLPMKTAHRKNPFGEWTIIAIGPTAERQHVLDRRIRPGVEESILSATPQLLSQSPKLRLIFAN